MHQFFHHSGAALVKVGTTLGRNIRREHFVGMRKTMATANFFGNKAYPATRIFHTVLDNVCHLQGKSEAYIQLLHFRLASIPDKASVRGKQVRQKLSDNARHIVAVFIEIADGFERKPTRAERSLLPKRKLSHTVAHFNRHIANRCGINFREFLQQRDYHMRMQAQVHVRVLALAPTVGKRSLKLRIRFVGQIGTSEDVRKKSQDHFLFGSLHVGVVFHRIGNAQVQVSKKNTPVEFSLQDIDIQRKCP